MKGDEYADLVAAYICSTYESKGLDVYREVSIGKSIIGKNRRVDVLVLDPTSGIAVAIECKYQQSQGTVDEKIPYALNDMKAMRMPGCIAYAGEGFSQGVIHMLLASETAAYCMPSSKSLEPSADTRELDHVLATAFN